MMDEFPRTLIHASPHNPRAIGVEYVVTRVGSGSVPWAYARVSNASNATEELASPLPAPPQLDPSRAGLIQAPTGLRTSLARGQRGRARG